MATATRWKELEFTIRFLTPAFLGDAEQKGRWRTPPFKALLRQWWRVAYAAQQNYDVSIADLRKAEGKLFGNAWLTREEDGKAKADYCSSRVRLRLDRWDRGELQTWEKLEPRGIQHPEVEKLPQIGPHLYLGYGPLIVPRGATITTLKNAPAIHAGKTATLRLAFPAGEETLLLQALRLMHLYGTAGGRSRNGWGSFVLEPRPDGSAPIPTRTWEAALAQSWAHAIGEDGQGALIWRTTKTYQDWRELMRDLAIVRIAVRTQFAFRGTEPHKQPEPRHWLSYPVTKHRCEPWGNQLRLPNSLRFKVRPVSGNANQLIGIIYHMPCLPPDEFRPQPYREQIKETWRQVHWLLDELGKPAGQRKFEGRINESKWLQKVSPQLSGITLQRIEE
jgi:CRISPR-associated protein Cmr1